MLLNLTVFCSKDCGAERIHDLMKGDIQDIYSFINRVKRIITIESIDRFYCLDDDNLSRSCQVSFLKEEISKCVYSGMVNLSKNILNQKYSHLCVPICVTTLIRHSLRNDLQFEDRQKTHTPEKILATLNYVVYPRSMAGLNLNPSEKENGYQMNAIVNLLERVCAKTYIMESGWEIIRRLGQTNLTRPDLSYCTYQTGRLSFQW